MGQARIEISLGICLIKVCTMDLMDMQRHKIFFHARCKDFVDLNLYLVHVKPHVIKLGPVVRN